MSIAPILVLALSTPAKAATDAARESETTAVDGGASADASAPAASTIELDLAGLEPIDPGVRAEVAKAIHGAAAGVVARHDLPAEKIHVRVSWQDQDDVDYAVRIHFDAHERMQASDHPATTGPDAATAGLVGVVEAALERALADWSREHESKRAAADVAIAGPAPAAIAPSDEPAPQRGLGRLGWAGVGTAIAGVAGLGGGIALVIVDRTADPKDDTRLRDWQPAGYALVALGGAAIVAGTVMAIVDTRPARSKRAARKAALRSWVTPRGGGVVLRLAF